MKDQRAGSRKTKLARDLAVSFGRERSTVRGPPAFWDWKTAGRANELPNGNLSSEPQLSSVNGSACAQSAKLLRRLR
jgi:hypothetical protein